MDNKKEYLNEERYQQTNQKVRKVGKVLLIVGIIVLVLGILLTILGFVGFGNTAVSSFDSFGTGNELETMKHTASGAFGGIGLAALGGFMNFIGFGLTIAGVITMVIGHRREITAYTTQQVMPLAQEGIDKMAPTIGKAAGTIAKGIKDGLKDDKE